MLHSSERKFGNEDEIILRPREFVVEVCFEVFDALSCQPENFSGVGLEFGGLGFADVDMRCNASVSLAVLEASRLQSGAGRSRTSRRDGGVTLRKFLPRAGGEGEDVC